MNVAGIEMEYANGRANDEGEENVRETDPGPRLGFEFELQKGAGKDGVVG